MVRPLAVVADLAPCWTLHALEYRLSLVPCLAATLTETSAVEGFLRTFLRMGGASGLLLRSAGGLLVSLIG